VADQRTIGGYDVSIDPDVEVIRSLPLEQARAIDLRNELDRPPAGP
jgi:hypothetical protein